MAKSSKKKILRENEWRVETICANICLQYTIKFNTLYI